MAGKTSEELLIKVRADTGAAERDLKDVDRQLDKLDKGATVEVKTKLSGGRDVDELLRKVDKLDREDADVLLRTNAQAIERDIRATIRQIDKLDADDPTITVHAQHLDTLRADLRKVEGEIDTLNHKTIAPDTRGSQGKLSGLVSSFRSGMSNMASAIGLPTDAIGGLEAGLAAAALAVGKFTIDAVNKFTNLGVEVGKFADATGTSTEFASRLIEVSGDLGIGADTIETAVGKMTKTLGKTPDAFSKYGVSVQHLKDGTVDVEGTFMAAIAAIQAMPDAAQRSAAAAAIFGKGWAGAAELINTPLDELQQRLADVSDEKVFGDDKTRQARKFRDAMDEVHDAVDDITLSIGQLAAEAAPAFKVVAGGLEGVLNQIKLTKTIVGASVAPFKVVGDQISKTFGSGGQINKIVAAEKMVKTFTGTTDELAAAFKNAGVPQKVANDLLAQYAQHLADGQVATDDTVESTQQLADGLGDVAQEYEDAAQRAQAYADQQRAIVDGGKNLADAERSSAQSAIAAAEARDKTLATLKDHKATLGDVAEAVTAEGDAAIKAASDYQAYSDAQDTAATGAVDMVHHVDAANSSLLLQATKATPAAQQSLVHYLAQMNEIPPDVETKILAAVQAGDLTTAKRLLDDASRTREAAINANANTTEAEKQLDNAARTRIAQINAQVSAQIVSKGGAGYGQGSGSGGSGPRSVAPMSVPVGVGAQALAVPTVVVQPQPITPTRVVNLQIHAGVIGNRDDVMRAVVAAERRADRLMGARR